MLAAIVSVAKRLPRLVHANFGRILNVLKFRPSFEAGSNLQVLEKRLTPIDMLAQKLSTHRTINH